MAAEPSNFVFVMVLGGIGVAIFLAGVVAALRSNTDTAVALCGTGAFLVVALAVVVLDDASGPARADAVSAFSLLALIGGLSTCAAVVYRFTGFGRNSFGRNSFARRRRRRTGGGESNAASPSGGVGGGDGGGDGGGGGGGD